MCKSLTPESLETIYKIIQRSSSKRTEISEEKFDDQSLRPKEVDEIN